MVKSESRDERGLVCEAAAWALGAPACDCCGVIVVPKRAQKTTGSTVSYGWVGSEKQIITSCIA
jgi:hypothetical protein